MILSFELTFPNVGSWDGKFTGAKNLHFKFVNLPKNHAEQMINNQDSQIFLYDFGDGWTAKITVRKSNSKEKQKILRRNAGFMGYDWMVKSIIKHNKIIKNP